MEIERKFLVASIPDGLDIGKGTAIRQGYVAVAEDGSELRIRDRGGVRTLTVKTRGGRIRGECEVEIGEPLFCVLWPMTAGRRVQKYRHELPHDPLVVELDVYEASLAGLLVAEVEFPDEGTADEFVAPKWFGEEVTEDPSYKNQALAC